MFLFRFVIYVQKIEWHEKGTLNILVLMKLIKFKYY